MTIIVSTQIMEEGKAAKAAGKTVSADPYRAGSQESADWLAGYLYDETEQNVDRPEGLLRVAECPQQPGGPLGRRGARSATPGRRTSVEVPRRRVGRRDRQRTERHRGQRKTTVLRSLSSTRRSECHLTARASATASASRPTVERARGSRVWSIRMTSCSMIGPSSRSGVT